MDFLDPKRKQAQRRRLLIGYILMAITIALAVWLLLISARGYWYDRKTGDIIQNGNVFVDSTPGGADIILNGKTHRDKAAARLVLPGGHQYTLRLILKDYREWSRTFSLEGGKVERITYPLLIPNTLEPSDLKAYDSAPELASQSPDRRWVLVQLPGQPSSFDLYDLRSPETQPVRLAIPGNILTEPSKPSSLRVIEWADNNRHVLLERSYNGAREYLLIDTTSIANSLNINTSLTINPSEVRLRNKKSDQLYIYDAAGGVLRSGDLKNRTISAAILTKVLAFKPYGADLLLYVTPDANKEGLVNFRIYERDEATYLLKSEPETSEYLLDIAEYDGTPYYVIGAAQDDKVLVYRDPLPTLKGQSSTPLLVSAVLRLDDIRFISFSNATQFIAAQSGNKLIVYDIEADRQYKLTLAHAIPLTSKLAWMGPSHFVFNDTNHSFIVDFDGSNEQPLVPSNDKVGMFFAPDYETMYTVGPAVSGSGTSWTGTSLRVTGN